TYSHRAAGMIYMILREILISTTGLIVNYVSLFVMGYDRGRSVRMTGVGHDVEVFCEMMDAHMAEIESPIEEQFIMNRVFFIQRKTPDVYTELREFSLWIGASDLMNPNEWVWMHSKARMGYRNWNMNRPEVMAKDHGRCLAVQPGPYFAWITAGCTERLNFICERE
ncbi:hypothetical protein BaRGS_00022842, partial [Batillaria attramentaria]